MITAHRDQTGQDVAGYLQRVSLPAAGAHGNAIDADTAGDYAGALTGGRLAAGPLLLNVAAQALRRGTLPLPDQDAGEVRDLGGSDRLDELAGDAWDDMDAGDQRLLAITLLESVLIDPDGETIADRLSVAWRFSGSRRGDKPPPNHACSAPDWRGPIDTHAYRPRAGAGVSVLVAPIGIAAAWLYAREGEPGGSRSASQARPEHE